MCHPCVFFFFFSPLSFDEVLITSASILLERNSVLQGGVLIGGVPLSCMSRPVGDFSLL